LPSKSKTELPVLAEQSRVVCDQIQFFPGFQTRYAPCAATPTSGSPSPSKSAMVGAPPSFASPLQLGSAGSGSGLRRMPPVQSWMRKVAWLTTTICGCGSSVLRPMIAPYLAKLAMAGKPSGQSEPTPPAQVRPPGSVGDGADGAVAVSAHLIERRGGLRAEHLAGGAVVDAVAHHDLRRAGRAQKPGDGRRAPPDLGGAVQPEEAAVAAEGDEAAVLVRLGGVSEGVVGVPAAGDEADFATAHAVAGRDRSVAVDAVAGTWQMPPAQRPSPQSASTLQGLPWGEMRQLSSVAGSQSCFLSTHATPSSAIAKRERRSCKASGLAAVT